MFDSISPNPDGPVLVIGAAGVDIVGRLRGELRSKTSTPAVIRSSYGGVARNVAENLVRLGQPVNLISVVGEDDEGDRLLQGLVAAGVNPERVLRTSQYVTNSYLAIIDSQGELQFALDDMRAINSLTPQFIREQAALFKEASILFVDANLPKDTLRTVMSLARRAHLPICADPTSVSLAVRLRPYLSRFFLMIPNNAEAAVLSERTSPVGGRRQALEVAKYLISQGVDIVIITMAEQGLCYATSESSGYIPAIKTSILDPTGAGDALTATVIFALLNDIPLDDAVRLGVSAASLTLRFRGAVVPDLSLEKLYDQLVI
ncbi:MAG TPA: carbohydrate kinase family protein [Anaerolineales bacterium]